MNGRNAIHNWEELLKEYLASEYVTITDFAKAKGNYPSLLRRNSVNWPNKGKGETESKVNKSPKPDQDSKENKSNVTKKVTEKAKSQAKVDEFLFPSGDKRQQLEGSSALTTGEECLIKISFFIFPQFRF